MQIEAITELSSNEEISRIYEKAAAEIHRGGLIAFPTETVYGLGVSGFNADAILRLFHVKKRPLSDPVILHVNTTEESSPLFDVSSRVQSYITGLQKTFWPGPLTIVARKSNIVPSTVCAGGEFVACRSPSDPIARGIIAAAGVPIAAPSANLFSRISPTRAEHVIKYFSDEDVLLIKCDKCCEFGIESSVVKVYENDKGQVVIKLLRSGAITVDEIKTACTGALVESGAQPLDAGPAASPGQCLTHYSPRLKSILMFRTQEIVNPILPNEVLECGVLLDLDGKSSDLATRVRHYRSLIDPKLDGIPASNNIFKARQIASQLFSAMHTLEELALDDSSLRDSTLVISIHKDCSETQEFQGILDRCTRAASGKIYFLPQKPS